MDQLNQVVSSLFQTSQGIFWDALPVAVLLCLVNIYASGEITGSKIEGLFRRVVIAILLLVGFHQISSAFLDLENYLIQAFGGDTALVEVFSRVGDKASEIKNSASGNWCKIGQMGLSIISTLSFLVLSIVKRFLDILHLTIWNLSHILGPIALLGCLSPTYSNIPKGLFLGMLEVSLWKPFWIILAKILLAIGFSANPTDPSQWFDIAVLNFAIAGLMARTPALVHGFLSGQVASAGASSLQTMIGGIGVAMAAAPMKAIRSVAQASQNVATTPVRSLAKKTRQYVSGKFNRNVQQNKNNNNKKGTP